MSNRLLVNPGTPQQWEILLQSGVNRLGRGDDNDFVINHQSISTHHCELHVSDAGVLLKDLGSTNGTFVDRTPVKEFQICNGQHIQFGAVDTVFEATGLPALPDAVNLPGSGARVLVANPGPAAPPPPPPPTPVAAATAARLTINRPAAHSAPAAATTTSAPPPRPMSPLVRQTKSHADFEAERAAVDRKMFVRGLVGAIGGGLVGMFGWYLIIRLTHMEIGYAAVMVGACTGAGARLLARQGSSLQGIVCGVCALLAIVGGEFFAIQSIEKSYDTWAIQKEYDDELKWAQSAVAATNRDEILVFLSVRDEVNSSSISEDDVKEFLQVDQPRYRDLVNGKPSKEEYIAAEVAKLPTPSVMDSISPFTFIWGLFGVAAAWRIGSGNAG